MTEVDELVHKYEAAVATLESMGYTHEGGVLWAPPLGDPMMNERRRQDARFIESVAESMSYGGSAAVRKMRFYEIASRIETGYYK